MRPFTWPHVIVPLLPAGLIEVLEAPVPILVETVVSLKNGVFWVVLDGNGKRSKIVCGKPGLLQGIKQPEGKGLKAKVVSHYGTIGETGSCFLWDDLQVHQALTIAKLIHSYWSEVAALIPESPEMVGHAFLNVESLQREVVRKAGKGDQGFLTEFTNSQVFILHVEERLKARQAEKTRKRS